MLRLCVNLRTVTTQMLMQNARRINIKWVTVLPARCSCVCSRILSIHRLKEWDNDGGISHQQNCKLSCKPNVLFLHYNAPINSSKQCYCQVGVNRRAGTLAAAFVNNSASALQPYMKLMRIDKPIGINPIEILTYVPG